jgi:adenylate cyclase class IV
VKHEIEMKFRAEDLSAVRRAVLRAGGRYLGTVLQTDCYLDTPEGALLAGDRGLRLRTSRRVTRVAQAFQAVRAGSKAPAAPGAHRGAPLRALLTYKGPRRDRGRAKSRREVQTAVEDPRALEEVLRELGLRRRLVLQKRRSTYALGRCRVELDELPLLGTFVEIEGSSPRAIEAAARRLGLRGPPLKAHYVQLAEEACPRAGKACLQITFRRCPCRSRNSLAIRLR